MTKAWVVYAGDEWCTLMHAKTRGRAIVMARDNVDCNWDYIDHRAKRLPQLDNKPFTWKDCADAGFEYFDYSEPISQSEFTNDCPCDICKEAQA